MTLSHTNDFFVTLPSNSSLDHFPANNPSEFKTKLAQPIALRGHWEVALAEIQYCQSWNNVTMEMNFYYGTVQRPRKLTIATGHYDTVDDVLSEIQTKMDDDGEAHLKLKYHHHSGKLRIHLSGGIQIVWMDPNLCGLLVER